MEKSNRDIMEKFNRDNKIRSVGMLNRYTVIYAIASAIIMSCIIVFFRFYWIDIAQLILPGNADSVPRETEQTVFDLLILTVSFPVALLGSIFAIGIAHQQSNLVRHQNRIIERQSEFERARPVRDQLEAMLRTANEFADAQTGLDQLTQAILVPIIEKGHSYLNSDSPFVEHSHEFRVWAVKNLVVYYGSVIAAFDQCVAFTENEGGIRDQLRKLTILWLVEGKASDRDDRRSDHFYNLHADLRNEHKFDAIEEMKNGEYHKALKDAESNTGQSTERDRLLLEFNKALEKNMESFLSLFRFFRSSGYFRVKRECETGTEITNEWLLGALLCAGIGSSICSEALDSVSPANVSGFEHLEESEKETFQRRFESLYNKLAHHLDTSNSLIVNCIRSKTTETGATVDDYGLNEAQMDVATVYVNYADSV